LTSFSGQVTLPPRLAKKAGTSEVMLLATDKMGAKEKSTKGPCRRL